MFDSSDAVQKREDDQNATYSAAMAAYHDMKDLDSCCASRQSFFKAIFGMVYWFVLVFFAAYLANTMTKGIGVHAAETRYSGTLCADCDFSNRLGVIFQIPFNESNNTP